MNRLFILSWFVSACLALFISAGRAQNADEAFAWIEPPGDKRMTPARRRELTLLRAAILAEERGYTHFELMQSPDAPARGSVGSDAWNSTDAYGNASNTIYAPHLTPSPIRPRSTVLVRFCNESFERCPGVRAHRVLLNLRP